MGSSNTRLPNYIEVDIVGIQARIVAEKRRIEIYSEDRGIELEV